MTFNNITANQNALCSQAGVNHERQDVRDLLGIIDELDRRLTACKENYAKLVKQEAQYADFGEGENTITMEKVEIEIINGVGGPCIAINGTRVAGPKPLGGGKVMKSWIAPRQYVEAAIKHSAGK